MAKNPLPVLSELQLHKAALGGTRYDFMWRPREMAAVAQAQRDADWEALWPLVGAIEAVIMQHDSNEGGFVGQISAINQLREALVQVKEA